MNDSSKTKYSHSFTHVITYLVLNNESFAFGEAFAWLLLLLLLLLTVAVYIVFFFYFWFGVAVVVVVIQCFFFSSFQATNQALTHIIAYKIRMQAAALLWINILWAHSRIAEQRVTVKTRD